MAQMCDGDIRGEISFSPSSYIMEWKVDVFSLLEGSVSCISSPRFQYSDAMWSLQCYPNGLIYDNYISLFLKNETPVNNRNMIKYELGIKAAEDGTVYRNKVCTGKELFSEHLQSLRFMKMSEFKKHRLSIAPHDVVTFFCILWITDIEAKPSKIMGFEGSVKLAQDLRSFMLNEQDCDITIKISGRDFKAHRSILAARSPVFSAMLSQGTLERRTGIVTVEDCDPDIFYIFLLYLYSGEVEQFTLDNACDLYAVADKYDVQELKSKCVKYMVSFLSVDNFWNVIYLAFRYKDLELIKFATDVFVINVKKIISTVHWDCLVKEYPQECNELYIKWFLMSK